MAFYVMYGPYDVKRLAAAKPDTYVNPKGNHECVEFVRQSTGAPSTRNWRPGALVKGNKAIPIGTAIATFSGPHFSTHAAIYLGQDDYALWVLDQWNAQGFVARRPIRFPTGKDRHPIKEQNNGDLYRVIDTKDTEEAARKVGEPAEARII